MLVFSLNTVIGFACAVGINMGFNTTHHHEEEATEAVVHIHKDGKKYHYKTIYDKFLDWSRLHIFKDAYTLLLKKYDLSLINSSTTLTLFIDSSFINNKNGSESVGYSYNRKKNATKLSAICQQNHARGAGADARDPAHQSDAVHGGPAIQNPVALADIQQHRLPER